MAIKAKKLKSDILKTGKKVGILVEAKSPLDNFLTSGTKVAATLVNDGEKKAKQAATVAKTKLDELRAKVHAATAPKPRPTAPRSRGK